MFKKKKKKDVILKDEVISDTSIEEISTGESKELEQVEVVEDIKIIDNDLDIEKEETRELIEGDFTFYDSDSSTDCLVDEENLEGETASEDESKKKELSSFFEASKKDNRKIKEKPAKEKRKSKRKQKKETEFSNIKDQKVFIFRGKKYSKVDDFIKYLNNHYLDIDKVAEEVLADENFYGWLSKKSGVFNDSIKQFKEIKEKIEKK